MGDICDNFMLRDRYIDASTKIRYCFKNNMELNISGIRATIVG